MGATTLLLLTGVERVLLDFGHAATSARWTRSRSHEARAHLADGQFPAGSMGPKVEAAIQFVEGGGGTRRRSPRSSARPRPWPGSAGTRIVA